MAMSGGGLSGGERLGGSAIHHVLIGESHMLPFLPTRTSTSAASVRVPLADSLSAVEFLLYFHLTPDALKLARCIMSERRIARSLAFSTLFPPADSAEHKKRNESNMTKQSILCSLWNGDVVEAYATAANFLRGMYLSNSHSNKGG